MAMLLSQAQKGRFDKHRVLRSEETTLFELIGGKEHPSFKEISRLIR